MKLSRWGLVCLLFFANLSLPAHADSIKPFKFVVRVFGKKPKRLKANPPLWNGVLDPNRATDWQDFAGVQGGIPTGWTQCGATIAAGASSATIKGAVEHTLTGYTGCGNSTFVQLGAGVFNFSFCSTHSFTWLNGMGADQTFDVPTSQSSCSEGAVTTTIGFDDAGGEFPGGNPTAVSWTSGFAKGTTQITITNPAALNITLNKTILVLDQCDTGYSGAPCSGSAVDNGNFFVCGDQYSTTGPLGCSVNGPDGSSARPHRWQEEFVLPTACSPNCTTTGSAVITIDTPLIHPNWASGQTPQVWAVQGVQWVGISNLSIDNSAITNANNTPAISISNASNFWITGVRVLNSFSQGIAAYPLVTHYEISSNYVWNSGHNSPGVDPNPEDPTNIIFSGENGLVVNNIAQSSRIQIGPTTAPAVGNVVAYNYTPNCFESNGTLWGGLWDGHQNGTDFNLYEGNISCQFYQDTIHGGKLSETLYRNHLTGWESCSNGNCAPSATQKNATLFAAGILTFNRYTNIIANVLGTTGISTAGYTFTAANWFNGGTTSFIYNWESGNNAGTGKPPIDPVVGTTAMRWGNWDANHGSTQWNTAEVPSGISVFPNPVPTTTCTSSIACPPSFYLAARPSWWTASIPFPAIGPDVTGGNVGACGGTVNTSGQFALVPAMNASECAGQGLNAAWAGHVNAIPAMACFLNVMGGPPDGAAPSGIGSALTFNANACFKSGNSNLVTPTETLTTSDAVSKNDSLHFNLSASLTNTSSATQAHPPSQSGSASTTVSESDSVASLPAKVTTEVLITTDSVSLQRIQAAQRGETETLALLDAAFASKISSVTRGCSETLAVADLMVAHPNYLGHALKTVCKTTSQVSTRTLGENLFVSDAVATQ